MIQVALFHYFPCFGVGFSCRFELSQLNTQWLERIGKADYDADGSTWYLHGCRQFLFNQPSPISWFWNNIAQPRSTWLLLKDLWRRTGWRLYMALASSGFGISWTFRCVTDANETASDWLHLACFVVWNMFDHVCWIFVWQFSGCLQVP